MAVVFDGQKKIFTLHTKNTTWQTKVSEYGHLPHLYYGRRIKDTDLSYMARGINRGFSGSPYAAGEHREYSLDTCLQEYPAAGTGDYRVSCLHLEHENGSQGAELLYQCHRIYDKKYSLPGLPALWAGKGEAQTLEINLKDIASQVWVTLYYGVFEEMDVITRACVVENRGQAPVFLNKALSACLEIPRGDLDMISFHGRHTMERMMERGSARHGRVSVDSVRGASSHHRNPFVILCDRQAGEEHGQCWGASFVYSGNFTAQAEVDPLDQTRLCVGIHPEGFRYKLEAGESFAAPEVVFTFTHQGFGKLSDNYHRIFHKHLIRSPYKNIRRPVLLNHWEAMEFNFNEEELVSLAESGKALGMELFVMDDGWFGQRDRDTRGLGDWRVNRDKLSSGLGGFAARIHDMGLKFGIWIEPEMINEDSDLYRSHPDWALRIPGRQPNVERGQLVLDMCRREVRDYLFDSLSEILKEGQVDYVKWDMNRNLSDVWSKSLPPDRQGEALHRYVLGVYELMERFVSAYPDILWEGCSGGGGRFDAGILYYMPQIWCSDNTDAVERLRIQYGTSFCYPPSSMGSHVSVSPNHQTGRRTSLKTRGIVAMAGAFGYELDVRVMAEEEREEVRQQIRDYKKYYDLIHHGTYYRLTDVEENGDFAAWQFVSPDRRESLVSVVLLHARSNPLFWRVRARGLEEEQRYSIDGSEETYEGSALMYGGINLPVGCEDNSGMWFYLKAGPR